MLRRVHEERMVGLFYGQRALCIRAVMPLNYVGTSETPTPSSRRSGGWSTPATRSRRSTSVPAHDLLMLGSLPPRVRELYGLSFTPDDGPVPLPRRWGQSTSSTTLPAAPRSSSRTSASPACSSG
jgi:hypothetical protein